MTIVGIKKNASRCVSDVTPGIDAAKNAQERAVYRNAARKAPASPAPRKGWSIPAPEEPEPELESAPPELELESLESVELESDESLVVVAERVAVETVPLAPVEPEPVPVAMPPEGMMPAGMVIIVETSSMPMDDGVPAGTVATAGCVVTGKPWVVTAVGWVVTGSGWPVTTPSEFVWARKVSEIWETICGHVSQLGPFQQ